MSESVDLRDDERRCKRCGRGFFPRSGRQRQCDDCGVLFGRKVLVGPRPCRRCGTEFIAYSYSKNGRRQEGQYCSPSCCVGEGSSSLLRICEVCGGGFRRKGSSGAVRDFLRACSFECGQWIQHDPRASEPRIGRSYVVAWASCVICRALLGVDVEGRARKMCKRCGTPASRRAHLMGIDKHGRTRREDVNCIYCGASMPFRRGREFNVCKRPECVADHRRYYKHLRREAAAMAGIRSRIKAGSSNPISLTSLGDRDGWRCQAEKCRYGSRKVRRDGGNDGLSPSVGHIIPVSALWRRDPDALAFVEHYGGLWVLENLRLEHKGCNSSARDRSGGQLRLVG